MFCSTWSGEDEKDCTERHTYMCNHQCQFYQTTQNKLPMGVVVYKWALTYQLLIKWMSHKHTCGNPQKHFSQLRFLLSEHCRFCQVNETLIDINGIDLINKAQNSHPDMKLVSFQSPYSNTSYLELHNTTWWKDTHTFGKGWWEKFPSKIKMLICVFRFNSWNSNVFTGNRKRNKLLLCIQIQMSLVHVTFPNS